MMLAMIMIVMVAMMVMMMRMMMIISSSPSSPSMVAVVGEAVAILLGSRMLLIHVSRLPGFGTLTSAGLLLEHPVPGCL